MTSPFKKISLRELLNQKLSYRFASLATSELFENGNIKEKVPFFERGYLDCCAEGEYSTAYNDTSINFPDELVDIYGGVEAQYNYVEFYTPGGADNVSLDDAMKIMEIAAKYYVEYRPDRREAVDDLIARARVSFARLQKNHDRWKRENG